MLMKQIQFRIWKRKVSTLFGDVLFITKAFRKHKVTPDTVLTSGKFAYHRAIKHCAHLTTTVKKQFVKPRKTVVLYKFI